jgi:hypothetical protein
MACSLSGEVADDVQRVRIWIVPAVSAGPPDRIVIAFQEPSPALLLVQPVPPSTQEEATMNLTRIPLVLAALIATTGPALVQGGSTGQQEASPPPQDCLAQPSGQDQQPQPVPGGTDPQTTQSLTDKLDPCDGVLLPPSVGDQELSQPPPDTGKMHEVKPGDLPGQQSNPQD